MFAILEADKSKIKYPCIGIFLSLKQLAAVFSVGLYMEERKEKEGSRNVKLGRMGKEGGRNKGRARKREREGERASSSYEHIEPIESELYA